MGRVGLAIVVTSNISAVRPTVVVIVDCLDVAQINRLADHNGVRPFLGLLLLLLTLGVPPLLARIPAT